MPNKSNEFCTTAGPEKVCISSKMKRTGAHELSITTHNRKVWFYLIIAVVLLLIIGFFLGWFIKPSFAPSSSDSSAKKGSYEEGHQAALQFARKRLAEEGYIEAIEEPVNQLRVTVKSVSGENVVVEFKAAILDVFLEGMATRTVVVSGDDVIEQHIDKLEEQLEKEYAEYEKAIEEYEVRLEADPEAELTEPEEPLEYIVQNLKVNDLKLGDELRVRTDSDIRTNDSFEATSIELRR